MALNPTPRWLEAASAGTADPLLLFEFRLTVLYAEKNCRADWSETGEMGGLDTGHSSDELRLCRNREVAHPEKQTRQVRDFYPALKVQYFSTGRVLTDSPKASLVQTFKVGPSFRLKKLYLGLRNEAKLNEELYQGRLRVRIFRDLRENDASTGSASSVANHIDNLLGQAREIVSRIIDFSIQQNTGRVVDSDGNWLVLDFSQENVWVPGGDQPCAITIEPEDSFHLATVKLSGSGSADCYSRGSLYLVDPETGLYRLADGDLSFKFIVDGYTSSGSASWVFDLGETPAGDLEGELQLRYCEPEGTRATFQMAEAGSLPGLNQQRQLALVSDGARVRQRFVKVRVTLEADSGGLDTPRVYSIRVAFRRSLKLLLASRPLFGYPNFVAEAPDYSAEGEPLSGESSATDTSRIVLLDPGGMAGELFSRYSLKNDEVRIWLGFDTPGFLDTSDGSHNSGRGDWLPFKTVWIEDWQPGEGRLEVHCYDQQVRFRQAQAPPTADPPEMTERIYYDLLSPARIKRDLLSRARFRPREIDYVEGPSGDPLPGTSFGELHCAFDWRLSYEIDRPSALQEVDSELNRHLLAFQVIDESGRWVTRFADFSAEFDPDRGWLKSGAELPCIGENDILLGSESYYPGLKYLRNYGVVFFGGSGADETQYAGIAVSPGGRSAKAHQEYVPDKLLSAFIPSGSDSAQAQQIAGRIAASRRLLQQDGVRLVEFSTALRFAPLQIGDQINFTSALYRRAGTPSPNPLLVLLTRKNIDRTLSAIHWTALVLLDAGQTAEEDLEVSPPRNLSVTPNGDGTLTWQWQRSLDDDAGEIVRYELFMRLSHLNTWGRPRHAFLAIGEENYTWLDTGPLEPLQYDFAIRAVHAGGSASALLSLDNVALTGILPETPAESDWELDPVEGGIQVALLIPVAGATHYNIYRWYNESWVFAGSFKAGPAGSASFVLQVDDPYIKTSVHLCLGAVNPWGESEKSAPRVQTTLRRMRPQQVLSAVVFDTGGGIYPLISRVPVGPHQAFSITLKVLAPSGEEDLVERYELERRTDSGSGMQSWSAWERIPYYKVRQQDSCLPAPAVIYYDNSDRKLTPGWYYDYRARAVGRNGLPGAWSATARVQLTEDATPPDRPTVSVENLTGQNRLTISAPSIDSGPCPDFSHFSIEGCEEAAGVWLTLDPHFTATTYIHAVADSELEKNWKYRVTAFDFSGNASETSLESAYKKQKKANTTFLAESVNTTLAQVAVNQANIALKVSNDQVINAINVSSEGITISSSRTAITGQVNTNTANISVNAANINLRVAKNDIINQINLSTEEITIDGERLHITADTVFDSDVIIQGVLSANGGLVTSAGSERIELGTFDGVEQIRFFANGTENGSLKSTSASTVLTLAGSANSVVASSAGFLKVLSGSTEKIKLWLDSGDATLTVAGTNDIVLVSSQIKIGFNKVLTVRQSAVGDAATASGNPATLADAVTKGDFNSLVGKFNTLLDRFGASGHGLTADA